MVGSTLTTSKKDKKQTQQKDDLKESKEESGKTSREINSHLGKAINGGGTWSTIAGKKQQNIQYPTLEDWTKLQELFLILDWYWFLNLIFRLSIHINQCRWFL